MTPTLGNTDFSGGLNVRDFGHLVAPNEGLVCDGFDLLFKTVKTLPGDRRILIDAVTYPEVTDIAANIIAGSGGGVPNAQPILGMWRYYYGAGTDSLANSWVRVHGTICEFWNPTTRRWIRIGNNNWPNGAVPTAVQFKNTMIILHGTLSVPYMGKFLKFANGTWHAGDIPIPGANLTSGVAFAGVGLNDMTRAGEYTGNDIKYYYITISRNPIGPVTIYGGGLDDMTTGGAYTGTDERTYLVEIVGTGLPDSINWSDDGGGTWNGPIIVTGAPQALSNGVTVTFGATTGHTMDNYWEFNCGPTDAISWSTDGGSTFEAEDVPIEAGVAIGLTDGFSVTFAAAIGHTVGDIWRWTGNLSDLPNLRPSFAVAYKNRLYGVSAANEPFTLRYSGVNLPMNWEAPEGGFVKKSEESGDPITGLFVHKDILLIFRQASVWRYWRDDYGFEHMGRIHGAAGCLSHNSICAYKDAVFYASEEGMMAIYGADSDCVTHKISDSIDADPDFLRYIQAVVNARTGTLWVTYLESAETGTEYEYDACGDLVLDACGDPVPLLDACGDPRTFNIYNTVTWRADIRRPNIISPRWVRLPYYRITAYGIPPQSNVYKGNDTQNLRWAGQQPDMTEWNPTPNVTPDPAYPRNGAGGPRHYCYVFNQGWDRDQIPAYNDACEDQLYAADNGIGYFLRFRTPTYIPAGNMRDVTFNEARLDYFIYKSQAAVGIDSAYNRVILDTLVVDNPSIFFPAQTTWWPIQDNTNSFLGGKAFQEYLLNQIDPSYGKTFNMEWTVVGTSNRERPSWSIEFGYFGVNYTLRSDRFNPDE